MYTKEKPKHRQLENGSNVRLIKEITNNDIKLSPMTRGRIVYARNQVEADVWINDSYFNSLNFDTSYHKNGRFTGIVLNLEGNSFAVGFNYDKHSEIIISEEKSLNIPLFDGWEEKKVPSKSWKRVDGEMVQQNEYLLTDVIDYLDDAFSDWVDKECEKRHVSDEEKESGDIPEEFDWVFTDEAQDKFSEMQYKLELEFAKNSGFYYHFLGGTIEC